MGEDRDTTDPVEKWADRVRFITGEQECDMHRNMLGKMPEIFRVTDLPKTEEESADIAEVVAALNAMRRSLCGLPPLVIADERVHITAPEEFRAKIAPGGRFQGKSLLGHVYLWRGWPRHEFQALLAHELAHAASYLWIDIRDEIGTTPQGLVLPKVLLRRQGMVLIDPSFNTLLPHFHGLNEGATELFAIAVRQSLAQTSTTLDAAARRSLASFVSSLPLLAFTDSLVQAVAGGEGNTMPTLKTLFLDYFAGTDRFLAALEARLPGATEVLRRTGARPKELLPAAERLGFERTAAVIRLFCR